MNAPITAMVIQGLNALSHPWILAVSKVLEKGPLRFVQIRDIVDGVTSKSLTVTLRRMEHASLVRRTVYPTVPPKVVYELTPKGKSLAKSVDPILDWLTEDASPTAQNYIELISDRAISSEAGWMGT